MLPRKRGGLSKYVRRGTHILPALLSRKCTFAYGEHGGPGGVHTYLPWRMHVPKPSCAHSAHMGRAKEPRPISQRAQDEDRDAAGLCTTALYARPKTHPTKLRFPKDGAYLFNFFHKTHRTRPNFGKMRGATPNCGASRSARAPQLSTILSTFCARLSTLAEFS